MFKALDAQDGREIIVLDQAPGHALEALRETARTNLLCCPVCRQPVSVKAGALRRWHFAHKDLGNCPSSHDPPELLQARAVLYEWLKTKFSEGVTLEKRPDGLELPRSIDCWVDRPNGTQLAYWIVHARMPPEDRDDLKRALTEGDIRGNFVFLWTMMQRNDRPRHVLNLATTERELMMRSDIDVLYGGPLGRSLHYLNVSERRLVTFRGMCCTEPPQQYQGHEIDAAMALVQVRPANGEFVHPGEWPRLEEWRQQERAREVQRAIEAARLAEEARQRAEEERQRAAEERQRIAEQRRRAEAQAALKAQRRAAAQARQQQSHAPPIAPAQPDPFAWKPRAPGVTPTADREGTCIFCGQRTRDWWTLNPDGTCKCRPCRAAGRI